MPSRRIPLFPLHAVLFPGMPLPLHVFEPRYQDLVRDCMAADRLFGVSLIRAGQEVGGPADPSPIGTTCEILSVTPLGEGRTFLSTVGRDPFRICRVVHERSYFEAEIEILPPPTLGELGEAPAELRAAATRYLRGMLILHGEPEQSIELPHDPRALSHVVGAILQSPLPVRQTLLEIDVIADRLKREMQLLRGELLEQEALLRHRARTVRPFQVRAASLSSN